MNRSGAIVTWPRRRANQGHVFLLSTPPTNTLTAEPGLMSNAAQKAKSERAPIEGSAFMVLRNTDIPRASAPYQRSATGRNAPPEHDEPGQSAPANAQATTPLTFAVHAQDLDQVVARALRRGGGQHLGLGLIFLSKNLSSRSREVARMLAQSASSPWMIASGHGIFTERGEEGEPTAVGMWIPGVRAQFIGGRQSQSAWGEELGDALSRRPRASALVFSNGAPQNAGWAVELGSLTGPSRAVMGAGTLPDAPLHWVDASVHDCSALAVILEGITPPHIIHSSACRLLTPLTAVTRLHGSTVLELEDIPALTVLSECTQGLDNHPLILLAVAGGELPLARSGRNLAVQPIEGVDPSRGGIVLGEPLRLGTRVAFAVRDAHAGRRDLRAHLETLRRNTAGAAPRFGLYLDCAGRGQDLYGSADVDARLIAEHFNGMPFLGLRSSYQMSLRDGRLSSQIYSGLLGVFCSPS